MSDDRGNGELHDEQPVQRVVRLVERRRDDQDLVRALDRLQLHAEARVAADGTHREGARRRPQRR